MEQETPQLDDPQRAALLRYVLGDLSAAEQAACEIDYFSNPAVLEQLQSLRDELLDDYLSGALPPDVRQKLAARLTRSAVWREKVSALRALRALAQETALAATPSSAARQKLDKTEMTAPPTWQTWQTWLTWLTGRIAPRGWAALTVGLVLSGLAWWLFSGGKQVGAPQVALLVTPTPDRQAAGAAPAAPPSLQPTPTPVVTAPKQPVATFALALDLSRQTQELAELALEPGTALIELQLDLGLATRPAAVYQYHAALYTSANVLACRAELLHRSSPREPRR